MAMFSVSKTKSTLRSANFQQLTCNDGVYERSIARVLEVGMAELVLDRQHPDVESRGVAIPKGIACSRQIRVERR